MAIVPEQRRLLASFVLLATMSVGRVFGADTLDTVQQAASRWASLRTESVRLASDWKWQKSALESSLAALQEKIKQMEAEQGLLEAEATVDASRTETAEADSQRAKAAMETINQRVAALTASVAQVQPWLPPRLASALELPLKSIVDPDLGAAERLQHTMTIFSRCAQFNKSITFAEDVLELDGAANPRLYEVVYWGLSHAYALDRAAGKAYWGHPGAQGWTWELRADAAEAVARIVDIYHEDADPAFVEVPAAISNPFPAENRN
jgi:Protein of unknown function (DUF3450)